MSLAFRDGVVSCSIGFGYCAAAAASFARLQARGAVKCTCANREFEIAVHVLISLLSSPFNFSHNFNGYVSKYIEFTRI